MKTTGTADDAVTATDSGNGRRSEQITSKFRCTNATRAPSDIAVEPTTAVGVRFAIRSPKVAPPNRISS